MPPNKERIKNLIETVFKRIPKNTEVEVIYSELCNAYNQGKIDSLDAIKEALKIKECQCH